MEVEVRRQREAGRGHLKKSSQQRIADKERQQKRLVNKEMLEEVRRPREAGRRH
jgi:hypothetical protein